MAKGKKKTAFFCNQCGYESAKWLGQCPGCGEWNSFTEELVAKSYTGGLETGGVSLEKKVPSRLSEITVSKEERILTGIHELDRVLGGGIVAGSLVLVGGDPGIGKSTLLLQMCKGLVNSGHSVLYVSGEESVKQIKMRAERLGSFEDELLLFSETNLELVIEIITRLKPEVVIIDSIQTMYREEIGSAPGSVSQVRETTISLMRLAKELLISIFVVGHVTKEGVVAGPRVLEHMVDTVLYFESDKGVSYRFLRGVKNRFGSTNEVGVFEMREDGLAEVLNPSEYMLQGMPKHEAGSVVSCSVEGTRPILAEVQALVCQTNFNMPRRTAAGTDYNRVNLLMAVMEKRLGLHLGECDAYINIAGGMRIHEPALDLAIVAAILSSYRNSALSEGSICFGEVGLTGEVRAVSMAEKRVQEAAKLGFRRCILPEVNKKKLSIHNTKSDGMELIGIKTVHELLGVL